MSTDNFKRTHNLYRSTPEPAIQSSDTGQRYLVLTAVNGSQQGGDKLVNRSYRDRADRAANDVGHRDVTRNLSASEIVSWFQVVNREYFMESAGVRYLRTSC